MLVSLARHGSGGSLVALGLLALLPATARPEADEARKEEPVEERASDPSAWVTTAHRMACTACHVADEEGLEADDGRVRWSRSESSARFRMFGAPAGTDSPFVGPSALYFACHDM